MSKLRNSPSQVSICFYSIILWTSVTSLWSSRDEEEDRWSFRRSIRAVTVAAILQNIYQCVFLIVQTSNIFSLLENVRNKEKIAVFST